MQRLKQIILLLAALTTAATTYAQSFYQSREYGISAGGAHYSGDLNDHFGYERVMPSFGVFTRLHMNPFIALRFAANATRVSYDDKYSTNFYNKTRNLNFTSNIVEGVLQAEFNFFRFFTGELNSRFTPYITMGVGGFYYDPYTTYQGTKYYLRPLGTEGQDAGFGDRRYSKFAMCFPLGVGVKYWLKPGLNLGFELANRLTTTDYMDDVSKTYVGIDKFVSDPQNPNPAAALQDRSVEVSDQPLGRPNKQRGDPSTKDQYILFQVNLSFQLKSYKCPAFMKEWMYQ
jgi:hypothetical protein